MSDLIKDEEKASVESALQHEPVVVFMGQVNSGKSSLANEVLGGSQWLPVSAEPCTSRLVSLKFSKRAYWRKIPFGGRPSPTYVLKAGKPKEELICLTDDERKVPENFKIQLEFGIPNPVLRPNMHLVDLPGWNESKELDTALKEILESTSVKTLLLIYVLDGNKSLRGLDIEFINLVKDKFPNLKILYACNKSDYEYEALRHNKGEGTLELTADKEQVFKLYDGTTELLENKALATFDKLQNHGLLEDGYTFNDCPHYHALSAYITKERRLGRQQGVIPDFFQSNFEKFRLEIATALQKILNNHILMLLELLMSVVLRFVESCLDCRKIELQEHLSRLHVLQRTEKEEQEAYSNCLAFLKEEEVVKSAIKEGVNHAKPVILQKAVDITTSDCELNSSDPLAVRVAKAISRMCHRQLHQTICEKMEQVQGKYLSVVSMVYRVVFASSDTVRSEVIRNFSRPAGERKKALSVSECLKLVADSEDDAAKAAVSVCFYIRHAVQRALLQICGDVLSQAVAGNMAAAVMGFTRVTEEWKKTTAENCLSLVNIGLLSTTILDQCKKHLEESHVTFIENLSLKIKLKAEAEKSTRGQRELLETEISLKIGFLMLRLASLKYYAVNGVPNLGRMIGRGKHSTVYECSSWGGLENKSLAVKRSEGLTPEAWNRASKEFVLRRFLSKCDDNPDRFIVRQYGTIISPLNEMSVSTTFVRIMEYRSCTLPEALKRGLTRDQRKMIALDVTKSMAFVMSKLNVPNGYLRAEIVSLDSNFRTKLDFSKIEESPYSSFSWLGIPNFYIPPELHEPCSPELVDRIDVYSLGCLLWEVFNETCKPPAVYQDCTTQEDIKRKVSEKLRPERLSEFEEDWWILMQNCWKPLQNRPSVEEILMKIPEEHIGEREH